MYIILPKLITDVRLQKLNIDISQWTLILNKKCYLEPPKYFLECFNYQVQWSGYSDSEDDTFSKINMNKGKYKAAKF